MVFCISGRWYSVWKQGVSHCNEMNISLFVSDWYNTNFPLNGLHMHIKPSTSILVFIWVHMIYDIYIWSRWHSQLANSQLDDDKLSRKNAVPCYLSFDVSMGRAFRTNLWAYRLAWMPDIHHTRKLTNSVETNCGTDSFFNGIVLNVWQNSQMASIYLRNSNDYV